MFEKRSKWKAFWLNDDYYGMSVAEWVGTGFLVTAVLSGIVALGIGIAALLS